MVNTVPPKEVYEGKTYPGKKAMMNTEPFQKTQQKIKSERERGSIAVEFALIFPIILTLLFGMIDFGRLLFSYEVLTNAAREGARQGIKLVNPELTQSDMETIVFTSIDNSLLLESTNATVNTQRTVVPTPGNPAARDLSVNVAYNFNFLVAHHLIPGLAATKTINTQSTMKMEI